MTYDWTGRWERNDITFHLENINPLIQKYWPELKLAANANVLVPLCGKTLDLLWLAQQNYHVIGAELSPIACESFFTENNLPFTIEKIPNFSRYFNDEIELYCGDFFALSTDILPPITAVYDRAALVALPDDLRKAYAKHLTKITANDAQILLIVHETPYEVKGPPYSVSTTEINQLFPDFNIKELARIQKTSLPKHWYAKGYRDNETFEVIYSLKK